MPCKHETRFMTDQILAHYLCAVAASDRPIDGRETDLMHRMLPDFGIDPGNARSLVAAYEGQTASLEGIDSREVGLALLRACLVIAYCDGKFDNDELPFLAPLVDRFQVSGEELKEAKLQALYYLRLEPDSIQVSEHLKQEQQWDALEEATQSQYRVMRDDYQRSVRRDLEQASEETCFVAMNVGPPSFDTSHARERYQESNPDHFHMSEEQAMGALREAAESALLARWESAYKSDCRHCNLEAPGRRRDECPRCGGEYGTAPNWS